MSNTELEVDILRDRVYRLDREVARLRTLLAAVYRAAIAHAGDTEAHPNSNNGALYILREAEPKSVESDK